MNNQEIITALQHEIDCITVRMNEEFSDFSSLPTSEKDERKHDRRLATLSGKKQGIKKAIEIIETLTQAETEEVKQWVSDVFFCCDRERETMTEGAMYETLTEAQKEKFEDDFSPDPSYAAQCANYWNELLRMYPN